MYGKNNGLNKYCWKKCFLLKKKKTTNDIFFIQLCFFDIMKPIDLHRRNQRLCTPFYTLIRKIVPSNDDLYAECSQILKIPVLHHKNTAKIDTYHIEVGFFGLNLNFKPDSQIYST